MIFQGIRTCIAKKPYIFVIFQGDGTPCPPSGSVHEPNFIVYSLMIDIMERELLKGKQPTFVL